MRDAPGKSGRWTALLLVLWGATLAGFAGRLWWPFDLLSSFRPHYAVAFLLIALSMTSLRRWLGVAIALVGLLVNGVIVTAPFEAVHASGTSSAHEAAGLRLVTLNVWFRNRDFDRVAAFLDSTAADVIVLQEVSDQEALEIASRTSDYTHAYVAAARAHHGVAILSRHPIESGVPVELVPGGVTVAEVTLIVDGRAVTVIGAHLHWPVGPRSAALRNAEIDALAARAAAVEGPVIVAGDLNMTLWSPWFGRLLAESGLAECTGGAALPGSWPVWAGPAAIRIDHCLMSSHFRLLATHRGSRVGSDHAPVVSDLAFAPRLARQ
jgi:endonuclease/exonuclease/phosphatase (EEP) superfamily protein YafD